MAMISFTYYDPRGARIAPGAFAEQVGQQIAVRIDGASGTLRGTLIGATVPDDGRCAHLTIDIEPELGMPEIPGIEVRPEMSIVRAEPWQDLQADHDGVTPYHEGNDRR